MKRPIFAAFAIFLAMALAACAGMESKQETKQTDYVLISAGFDAIEANTPARMAHLKSMPQQRILHLVRGGKDYYLWADATDCQCLWVGTYQDYQRFKKLAWDLYNQGGQNRLNYMDGWSSGPVNWDMWGPW
ncbi:MAG: hypothetical protein KJ720_03230 [Proteobacteria bacterium]|nr:hypothetical protein [Pseudomonadota bacterium]MBU1451870.1 hypothetical protein [Pseudomonadota bacterium]MBU2468486.1 hypothetical protein [Pseudomonadota bacterium]